MPRDETKSWSKSFGPYGARVRIFVDPDSGIYQAETADKSRKCGRRSLSLRHRDRARAERWARDQVAKLQRHADALLDLIPTLELVLHLYFRYESPKKVEAGQRADERRGKLWTSYLGADKDLRRITRREWDTFVMLRRGGTIDARGQSVEESARRPVRAGTVKADLVFLRTLIHWAMRWQDSSGRYLMREDPTRGFPMPKQPTVRRPIATTDRYERVRAAACTMKMRVSWGETQRSVPSHLPAILTLAFHTGRRISSILALRYEDLVLDRLPHPAIRWRADADKMNRESLVPMAPEVKAVLQAIVRERPGTRRTPVFPAPTNPSKPVSVMVASAWLVKAEQLAGVDKQDGSLWHVYRRHFATSRKHLSDIDVAAAGGWANTEVLRAVYMQADETSMYEVVTESRRIMEA